MNFKSSLSLKVKNVICLKLTYEWDTLVDCNRARESMWELKKNTQIKIQNTQIKTELNTNKNTRYNKTNFKMIDEWDTGWLQQGTWVHVRIENTKQTKKDKTHK